MVEEGLPPIEDERFNGRWALAMRDDELAERELRGDWYAAYLESDVWRRTRDLALEYYGNACCLCNGRSRLDVHHRTYDRAGQERLADLIVLCRQCHAHFHRRAA